MSEGIELGRTHVNEQQLGAFVFDGAFNGITYLRSGDNRVGTDNYDYL